MPISTNLEPLSTILAEGLEPNGIIGDDMTARALQAILFSSLLATSLFARPDRHVIEDETPTATVLCHHIVESPQDPRMEISREAFHQQMRYLSMTGYNVIPLRNLYDYVTGKRASIPRNAVV